MDEYKTFADVTAAVGRYANAVRLTQEARGCLPEAVEVREMDESSEFLELLSVIGWYGAARERDGIDAALGADDDV